MPGLPLDGAADLGYRVAGHGSVEGALGVARVVSRPFFRFEGHLGAAEKPSIFEGALLARSDPDVVEFASGDASGSHPPRYQASDRRSLGSPASFSNSA